MSNDLDANEKIVLKVLADSNKPLRPGEIAEIAGIDKALVSKALLNLKKGKLACSPKRCYYDSME